jgi:hypothetical protein
MRLIHSDETLTPVGDSGYLPNVIGYTATIVLMERHTRTFDRRCQGAMLRQICFHIVRSIQE